MTCYTLTYLFRVNEPYLVYNEALAKRMKLRKYALVRELAVQRSYEVCETHTAGIDPDVAPTIMNNLLKRLKST